ncbi:MAG: tetratricopeptide repeat protein, partial [Candidatus Sulfotelmatobacter sp.]
MNTPAAQFTSELSEAELLSKADSLAANKKWIDAVALLRPYTQANNLSHQGLAKLAHYHSRARQYDVAIALYKRLIGDEPNQARWFYALGYQHEQKGQWGESIASYEQSLRIAPAWLLPALRLGAAYQLTKQTGKCVDTYRRSVRSYRELPEDRRRPIGSIFAKLCSRLARCLLSNPNRSQSDTDEALGLLAEATRLSSSDADGLYQLGCAFLESGQLENALEYLNKAATSDPKKEYTWHKIAQAHLKKGDPDSALAAYRRIPVYKMAPYVLHGIAQCHLAKGEPMEGAKRLHEAILREPGKFYHYCDFAQALLALGARDQALEALEQANERYTKEYGRSYSKAQLKIREVVSAPTPNQRISFEESETPVPSIRFGKVIKYDQARGFGFIKDEEDGSTSFFHITRVNKRLVPTLGGRVR